MAWIFNELLKDYTGEHVTCDVIIGTGGGGCMESTAAILLVIDYHESTCERTYRQNYQSGETTQDQSRGTYNLRKLQVTT
jgi:alcohol dehydrogenase class IV